MKPRVSSDHRSERIAHWPLLGIFVGCALGIILRNWSLGLAVTLLAGMVFLHANFQLESRREKISLAAAYALGLLALVLAARGRPELVWLILFAAAVYSILSEV